MTDTSSNNKRIAKNTILLYFRTLFIMAVSLYTSRVVLNVLGVEDYGIYNVVGGVVAMFSVISGSLSSSISRYITYELGHGDYERLKKVFATSVNIQVGISVVIIMLAEVFGVWFLNSKMNIPSERMPAANWVLQCSLLSFVINLISVPYNACIIAHERMSAFAYISILEAVLKLVIVYTLVVSSYDKLVTYAVLLVSVSLLVRFAYGVYCRRNFQESRYKFVYDKPLMKEMTGFAGWSFFGNGAYLLNAQGIDILVNIFFGVAFNAARGVATQVQNAVMQFVNNFTVAINPQITKSYASGDLDYMFNLVCRGAKYSYFLLLVFVVPIVCEADYILKLWLSNVPAYAPVFLQLSLFGALMNVLGVSMQTGISATGKIKTYQLCVTLVGSLVFLISWVAFKSGCPVVATYVIYIIVFFILVFIRAELLKRQMGFPFMTFMKNVMSRIFFVTATSFILPLFIKGLMVQGITRLSAVLVAGGICTVASIYSLGCDWNERMKIKGLVKDKILSFFRTSSNRR